MSESAGSGSVADGGTAGMRRRTVAWDDIAPVLSAAARMSGLDLLRAIAGGDLPQAPIARVLGYDMVEVERGRAVFACMPDETHYNPVGRVHGGLPATLLDSATACAVHSELPAGTAYTTLALSVDFLRGMDAGSGPVRCEGRLVRLGRQIAIAEGEVVGADGTVHARGSSTCLIFAPRGNGANAWPAGPPGRGGARSRSFAWSDPAAQKAARERMAGRAYFKMVADGGLPQPPIYETLGFRVTGVGDGASAFECVPGEHQYNPVGTVHGGLPATLIDSATGVAVQSQLPADAAVVTIKLSVDYLQAITADSGPLRCEGVLVRCGSRIAVADARLTGTDGALFARGHANFLVARS